MNSTANDYIALRRASHHKALEALRSVRITKDGLSIWRQLRRIESEASKAAEDYCNGLIDHEGWERAQNKATRLVVNALGHEPQGFFVNGDPRGYALKIDNESGFIPEGMHKDWGGYGILAAEID